MSAPDEVATVDDVAEAYVVAYADLDPVGATRFGLTGHDGEMTDFSPEGAEARAELARRARRQVCEAKVVDDADRLAADVMVERLTADIDIFDSGEWRRDLNVLFSPLQQIREAFDLMATETAEDWQDVLTRMSAVPATLIGLRATLEAGVAAGTPAARRQAVACAGQVRSWSQGVDGSPSFFGRLAADSRVVGVDERLSASLDEAAEGAGAALGTFGQWLADDYAPVALDTDAVGADRYRLFARAWNGIDLDLDETYRWGWGELGRIDDEMKRVAALILPGGSLAEARTFLENDPDRVIEGEENLRRWLQDLMDDAIAGLNGAHFDIPPPLQRLEAMIAPPGGAAAQYYTAPSEDFRRPGRTWYPTQGRTRFPTWGEVSTAYHEGVPGHHLQIGMTQYLKDRLNRFQRTMAFTAGHGEGWALYGERLMGELGYLDKPDYELGMLSAQAMRAVRVVVDIGLHLQLRIPGDERFHPDERWTPDLAAQLLAERASQPPAFVASEIDRYLGMPGQAISYKVGERVWLAGREAARRRAGARFDLRRFHANALGLGPMGLAQLSSQLERC